MLIKYEYELLSSIVANGIAKVSGDIVVLIKRIDDEFKDEKFNEYLQNLELDGVIEFKGDKISILVENWVELFVSKMNETFTMNNMNVLCQKKVELGNFTKEFYVEFLISGISKKFRLAFNQFDSQEFHEKDLIFMNMPVIYGQGLYWLNLINNINLLNQFILYLRNEAININKNAYREINIFDGIDDKYINEIFNVSIKRYFKKKKYPINNFNKEDCDLIENLFTSKNLSYYGVQFQQCMLWIIKTDKRIKFITIENNNVIYSENIEEEINILQDKLIRKVSEFTSLMLYKENNILDGILKTSGKITTISVPISTIISLLAFININLGTILNNKIMNALVVCSILVLSVVQVYLLRVIIVPLFRLSIFSWKIK